jgi:hypothetical protein
MSPWFESESSEVLSGGGWYRYRRQEDGRRSTAYNVTGGVQRLTRDEATGDYHAHEVWDHTLQAVGCRFASA